MIGGGASCRLRVRLYVERACATSQRSRRCCTSRLPATRTLPRQRCSAHRAYGVPGRPNGTSGTVDLAHALTRVCGTDFVGRVEARWPAHVEQAGMGAGRTAAARCRRARRSGRWRRTQGGACGAPGNRQVDDSRSHDGAEVIACQEDRVAWMRDGSLVPAENAFFSPARLAVGASTTIRHALRAAASHLRERPSARRCARPDRVPGGGPGRVVFTDGAATSGALPHVVILLVRNQNVLPAVARLEPAAARCGRTSRALEGQSLDHGRCADARREPAVPVDRSRPGTRRLRSCSRRTSPEIYVLNTGRVGGPPERAGSRDIEPRHSAAIVAARLRRVARLGARGDARLRRRRAAAGRSTRATTTC